MYDVLIERPARGRVGRVVAGVADLVAAGLGGLFEFSSAGTVVVRRHRDGAEVLTLDGGSPEELAQLVDHLRRQLAELSPAEFRERWGIAE